MDKCILFGAGGNGKAILEYLTMFDLEECVDSFCDSDENKVGGTVSGKSIITYENAKQKGLPIAICTINKSVHDEISAILKRDEVEYYSDIFCWLHLKKGMDLTELNRNYCAYYHKEKMDSYYEEAEEEEGVKGIKRFWGEDSPFYRLFKCLDLDDVIELGCGRGRHVNQYYNNVGHLTLVDILEKNIEICRKRFEEYNNISYYKNDGYDLKELSDEKYSALFTYDAMVHFEMFDIYEYLKETHRVLRKGGMALFHHSNLALEPNQSFNNSYNSGARSFMDKKLFAYLSYKAGLEIVEQWVIDWSQPKMDCITLVVKR